MVWRWARPCTALQALVNSWVFLREKCFIVTLSGEATCSGLVLKGSLAGVFHYIIGVRVKATAETPGSLLHQPGQDLLEVWTRVGEQVGRRGPGFQLSFAYMIREVFAMERDLLGTVPRPWASLIVKREIHIPGTTKAETP